MPRKSAAASRAAKKPSSGLLPLPQYKALIEGLMSQGLPHADAVETLSAGLRQANGRPVREATLV